MKFLSDRQRLALKMLAKTDLKNKFYWSGGTLLAFYYLKHRRSEDMDFFSETEFSYDELQGWLGRFKSVTGMAVKGEKIFDRWQFLFEAGDDALKVEFVYYNHGRKMLDKRGIFEGVEIDSLEDLAANKMMAYLDRNEPKDVVDIYFLIKKAGYTPGRLLAMVDKKFGVEFGEGLFWSESFRKVAGLGRIEKLLVGGRETIERVKKFFELGSREFLREWIG